MHLMVIFAVKENITAVNRLKSDAGRNRSAIPGIVTKKYIFMANFFSLTT